jgi:hypothetical protein
MALPGHITRSGTQDFGDMSAVGQRKDTDESTATSSEQQAPQAHGTMFMQHIVTGGTGMQPLLGRLRSSISENDAEAVGPGMQTYVESAQARMRAAMSRAPSSDTVCTDTTPMLGTPVMPALMMAHAKMAAGRHAPREPEGFRMRSSPLQRRVLPEGPVVKPGDQLALVTERHVLTRATGQKAMPPSPGFD